MSSITCHLLKYRDKSLGYSGLRILYFDNMNAYALYNTQWITLESGVNVIGDDVVIESPNFIVRKGHEIIGHDAYITIQLEKEHIPDFTKYPLDCTSQFKMFIGLETVTIHILTYLDGR